MNDLISDGPVDVAPECSSVHRGLLCSRVPSSHHTVGKGLRWRFPHLNAITNTFLDIWGLLYACSLLFARVLPSCCSSTLSFCPPHNHILLTIIWRTVASFKPREDRFTPRERKTLHTSWPFKEEQSGIHFLVHLIQHNLNFSAAKPNWPCSFTYMSLYTHAMYFVACMYEYETYGFIHDMLDLWLRNSY